MFENERGGAAQGRYRVELVSGQFREKGHREAVQEVLDAGSAQGWRLVNATTSNAAGTWVTGIFWDTAPER